MASQQRPPRRNNDPARPALDLNQASGQLSFDPKRVSLFQIAIVGFLIGVLFHACVVYAVLDDGKSASGSGEIGSNNPEIISETNSAVPTATQLVDRTDCNQIRGTGYRSETERQWFQRSCT